MAALVLASHKVLLPFLRDEKEVLQVRRLDCVRAQPWAAAEAEPACQAAAMPRRLFPMRR